MTAAEIADELFHCGKQVKQCFLIQTGKCSADFLNRVIDFSEYLKLLKQLQILYRSLGAELENLDERIQNVMDLGERLSEKVDTGKFISDYINLCNDILINTIKFRKKYSIIRRDDRIPGIGSHVITNLGQILFSLDNGYIPVIDTVNADNIFTEISREYSVNAWELYFHQPMAGLEEVQYAAEVKHLNGIPDFKPDDSMDCLLNPGLMGFWQKIMRKYMRFSPEMEMYTEQCMQSLPFRKGIKIAGVLCRGTDYVNIRPYRHPVQPSIERVISDIEQIMEKQKCDYCYLVTEDQAVLETLKNRFGHQLLTTQKIYYPTDSSDVLTCTNDKMNIDIHQKNMEYLAALAILAKCQVFIGGRTSGTVTSFLFAEGFEQIHIWNEGRYGLDDVYTTLASHIF